MRAPAFTVFAALFLVFATFAAAWPWPQFMPDVDSLIVRRQDNNGGDEDAETSVRQTGRPAQTPSPSEDDEEAEETGSMTITASPSRTSAADDEDEDNEDEDEESSGSDRESGSNSRSGSSNSRSGSATTATSTKRKNFDLRDPAGGVTMLEPAATARNLPVYKIGQNVTFAFSLTSCQAWPTAVNVLATCTGNQAKYTVAANASVAKGSDKTVYWDTAQYGNKQAMLTEKYNLIIHDADGAEDDPPEAGYLAPFTGLKFAMYQPSDYSDEPEGPPECITCSAGATEKAALVFVVSMAALAVGLNAVL